MLRAESFEKVKNMEVQYVMWLYIEMSFEIKAIVVQSKCDSSICIYDLTCNVVQIMILMGFS